MIEQESIAYNLTDKPTFKIGDIIKVSESFYQITQFEPLYYVLDSTIPGFGAGFATTVYPVPDLIPPKDKLYYITGFGIDGNIEVQIKYQANSPRNTVGARSSQRLNRINAHWTDPFRSKFVIQAGDTLEIDVRVIVAPVFAALWFYGWKLHIRRLSEPPADTKVLILEDVRSMGG